MGEKERMSAGRNREIRGGRKKRKGAG